MGLIFGIALAAALMAIPAIRYLRVRGLAPASRTQRLLVLQETIALDPRRRIHLVACDGKRIVLLTGGPQDLLIGWLPET